MAQEFMSLYRRCWNVPLLIRGRWKLVHVMRSKLYWYSLYHPCSSLFLSISLISINLILRPGRFLAPPHTISTQLIDIIGHKATFSTGQCHKATRWCIHCYIIIIPGEAVKHLLCLCTEGRILSVRPGSSQICFRLLLDYFVNIQIRTVPSGVRQPRIFLLWACIYSFLSPEGWSKEDKL